MEQIASEFYLTFFIFRRNSVQAVDQITIDRIVIFFVETDSQKLFQILQLCHTIHDICTICLFDDQLFFLIIFILNISYNFLKNIFHRYNACGLSVFIGSLLTNGWGGPQSFQIAMTNCCAVAVALFGGYFLAAYAINEMGTRMFGMHSNMPLTQQFAGYALVVSFLLQIVTGLLPDFRIIAWLLQFYIVYVVWEGVPILMGVEEKQRLKYTLLSSVLLILCPAVIQIVFNRLTAILN